MTMVVKKAEATREATEQMEDNVLGEPCQLITDGHVEHEDDERHHS